MSRQLKRAHFYAPAALLAALLAASCLDHASEPKPLLVGHFAVAPSFASASAGIVDRSVGWRWTHTARVPQSKWRPAGVLLDDDVRDVTPQGKPAEAVIRKYYTGG